MLNHSKYTLARKTAVITGAASGIGKGLAARCSQEGMNVILADIEYEPLKSLEVALRSNNPNIRSVLTDVSQENNVRHLAEETLRIFGEVHFLFNNAGVGVGGSSWEASSAHWNWAIDVNLKGTIYGLKYFIPIMLTQDQDCTVVNTASLAGLTTGAGMAPYIVTKHAVVSLTECLFHDLAQRRAKIKTAVFCPTIVQSNIMDSFRNAPDLLKLQERGKVVSEQEKQMTSQMRAILESGMSPEQAADCVFDGLKNGHFYIHTHAVCKSMVETRFEDMRDDRPPTLPKIPG